MLVQRSKYFGCAITGAVISEVLSIIAVLSSSYLLTKKNTDGYIPWNETLLHGPTSLFTPVASEEGFQEVLLWCCAVAYGVYAIMAILLFVGALKVLPSLYVPWLIWSGLMIACCVFGIFHLLSFMYNIYQYVLAEYIMFAVTILLMAPLSVLVHCDYRSRNVQAKGQV